MTAHSRDIRPPSPAGKRAVLRAPVRHPLPAALTDRPWPKPPRTGIWGASAFAIITLLYGAALLPTTGGSDPQGPVDRPSDLPLPIVAPVPVAAAEPEEADTATFAAVVIDPAALPIRVREAYQAAADAAKAAEADMIDAEQATSDAAADPTTPETAVPVPALPLTGSELLPPDVVPIELSAPDEESGDAGADEQAADPPPPEPAPEELAPPHVGAARDGVPMAALTVADAGSAQQVEAWLSAGLAEVHLTTTNGMFIATFGPAGYDGPVAFSRADVADPATTDLVIRFREGLPPGLSLAGLGIRLGQQGYPTSVEKAELVLTERIKQSIRAAQTRLATDLQTAGLLPATGVEGLAITICLDPESGNAAIAAAELRTDGSALPVISGCQ